MGDYNLNDLHSDAGNIAHLIDTIMDVFQNDCIHAIPECANPGDRLDGMDRLGALLWIARDLADSLEKNIATNYGAIGSTCKNWKSQAESAQAHHHAEGSTTGFGGHGAGQ